MSAKPRKIKNKPYAIVYNGDGKYYMIARGPNL